MILQVILGKLSLKPGKCSICSLVIFFPFISFHSSKEKPTAWKTGETEDYSQDTSYLEELEKHKFSVW